ncbi:MAG TPA: hypothetical protein VF245_12670 [Solirubrobacterales bacterium]
MALVKDTNFKFRLSEKQKADLKRLAEERGLSAGELILRALGLEGDEGGTLPAAATGSAPDPKKEPGAAGIAELADRMARKRRKK